MLVFSTTLIIFIHVIGFVFTNPISESSSNLNVENLPSEQAFRRAEQILNHYYHLIQTDSDHLVHGMLHVLLNNPKSFPYIPYRAMQIALQSVEQKLGHEDVEDFTKPLITAIDDNYRQNHHVKPIEHVKLPDEVRVKIEDTLDKFFHGTVLNNPPL